MAKTEPDPNVPKRPTKGGNKGVIREYLEAIGIALAVALLLRPWGLLGKPLEE